MRSKLLPLVVFIFLGIVGCDDPEVQDKIAEMLEFGGVSAELKCTSVPFNFPTYCSSSSNVNLTVHKFIDGSNITQLQVVNGVGPYTQFNPRTEGVGINSFYQAGGYRFHLELDADTGIASVVTDCPYPDEDTANLNSEGSCTGRNLEAFGITP